MKYDILPYHIILISGCSVLVPFKTKTAEDFIRSLFNDAYATYFLGFCIKAYMYNSNKYPQQMLLKEVDKSNLKTTKLLDYALIGVCEVITCRLKMIGTKKKKI